jgi:hypothetical protein
MRTLFSLLFLAPLAFGLAAHGQNPSQTQAPATQTRIAQSEPATEGRGAGGDIGSGSGDIGKGTGEGAGKAAEGVDNDADDLATLRPATVAEYVGKGAGDAAKDVGVDAVKDTGKLGKGTCKLIAKPFHHSRNNERPDTP